jgi:glutamate--cysteine ligase
MELKEKIKSVILSPLETGKDRMIGIELEDFIYDMKGRRIPVNPGSEYSASDLLKNLIDLQVDDKYKAYYSIEPGGQIEWASTPRRSLHDVQIELNSHQTRLNQLFTTNQLETIDLAVEPIYLPNEIDFIDHKKYKLMHELFLRTGKYGPWMMRNTTSVQVNIDILSKTDAEEMAFLADCLNPFCVLLFANGPFMAGKPAKNSNNRYNFWNDTDPSRCGDLFDHGIHSKEQLLDKFVDIVLDAPSIFTISSGNDIKEFDGSLKQWLQTLDQSEELDEHKIDIALHQIFTHVRFKKHVLEVRVADRPPTGFEMAPAAFWVGLLTVDTIRDQLMKIFSRWSVDERKIANANACILNLSNIGPAGKNMMEWINIFSGLALDGLKIRSESLHIDNEQDLLTPYLNIINVRGIPAIFMQDEFYNNQKQLIEFLRAK